MYYILNKGEEEKGKSRNAQVCVLCRLLCGTQILLSSPPDLPSSSGQHIDISLNLRHLQQKSPSAHRGFLQPIWMGIALNSAILRNSLQFSAFSTTSAIDSPAVRVSSLNIVVPLCCNSVPEMNIRDEPYNFHRVDARYDRK